MSILQGATQIVITGGTQVAAGPGSNIAINQVVQAAGIGTAFKDLSAAAAHKALHDSAARFNAPRCHRNTRSKCLNNLECWMLGRGGEHTGARLIWLTGGAGAGKSAIMQSIVERCTQHAAILGTFFFSRSDSSRNHADVLVPTLAYQLARAFPQAMTVLGPVIDYDPLIFRKSLRTQAYELLVRPLLYLIEVGVIQDSDTLRRVFIIDGLDECNNPQEQAVIVDVVASILCEHHVPISFLIASRPEQAISNALRKERRFLAFFALISLDEDEDASADIYQYIQDSFANILVNHPLRHHITLPWPKSSSVATLVSKSSDHFIYAATAMRFIASYDEHPTRALQVVEGLRPSRTGSPFPELDALYRHILETAKYSSQVLDILRHCHLSGFKASVSAACCVLSFSPEDVELYLSDVVSLISLSPSWTAGLLITSKHASLGEFLTDENGRLYITVGDYHASFLERYFQLLDNGPQAPAASLYSSAIWYRDEHHLIPALCSAIVHSRDTHLFQILIGQHPPQEIWKFCAKSFAINAKTARSETEVKSRTSYSVCKYMRAVRDSTACEDASLYIHHFKLYIQLLLEDLNQNFSKKPQYRIIPALMLAGELIFALHRRFHIETYYGYHFLYLQAPNSRAVDPRSFRAIRSMPHARSSWGSDLAITMKLVLQQLVGLLWTPEILFPNPHRRWLRKRKPFGHPRALSSTFYSYLSRLPDSLDDDAVIQRPLRRHGYSDRRALKLLRRRRICFLLLKTVVLYLHKSDCTSEVAKLARKSLPKAALWFPKLMKKARTTMDTYVLWWDESSHGLLERTRSLSTNDMD